MSSTGRQISIRMKMPSGEVFFADLFHGGKRPVVVVTREALNRQK